MEEILDGLSAGKRPIIFVAPLINAHNKNPDRLAGRKFILYALEKKVVPAKCNLVLVDPFSFDAKVYFADFAALAGVAADDNQEALALAGFFRGSVLFHADKVVQRTAKENVIPGRDVQRGNANFCVMFFNGPALPVIVVRRVREPIEVIRSNLGSGDIDYTRRVKPEDRIVG